MTRVERYADRKARRVCVDCDKAPAVAGRVRCRSCRRSASEASQRWALQHREREREIRLHRVESLRHSNPEVFREESRVRRRAKADNGICYDCARQAVDGVRCRRHRDLNRRYARRNSARRRRRERIQVAAYRPLDEVVDLTKVRLLRAALRLEWFTTADLNEELGHVDDRQRNTLTQALNRLTRGGRFARRRAQGGHVVGSPYEYEITDVGRAELAAILRGEVAVRCYPTRRAA